MMTLIPGIGCRMFVRKQGSAIDLNAGLIAHYNFSEASGSTIYDQVGNYDLTVYGSILLDQPGLNGSSVYFPAVTGAYISGNTPMTQIEGNEMTISLWVKFDSLVSDAQTDRIWEEVITGSAFPVYVATGAYTGYNQVFGGATLGISVGASDTVETGVWYMLTLRVTLYTDTWLPQMRLDDKENVGSDEIKSGTYEGFGGGLVYLGRRISDNVYARFNGWIDDIRIWDRVLSDEEIVALYNNGNGLG